MTTLAQFIATKPVELRLGQHFYNTYLQHLKPEHNTHRNMDFLYNTTSVESAVTIITAIMDAYQWKELPDG